MTLHTLTTPAISKKSDNKLFVAPLLNRIKKESRQEFVEMQEAFKLMGWGEIPDDLKIEIYDDVRYMVQELKGFYSSCDQFVQQRRNTVHFWISSFQDGICSLEAAIKALKVKSLA